MRRILRNYSRWNYYGYAYINGVKQDRYKQIDSRDFNLVLKSEPDIYEVAVLIPKYDCLVRIESPLMKGQDDFITKHKFMQEMIGCIGSDKKGQWATYYLFFKEAEMFESMQKPNRMFDIYLPDSQLELITLREEYERHAHYN